KSENGRVVTDTYTSKAPFNPWADWSGRNKISYDNDGEVKWLGGFGQVEYSKDAISVFLQGSVSNQWFRRIDYTTYDRRTEEGAQGYKTSWKRLSGGSIKGGINYNINENHNVFVNSGFFSRQPFMTNGVYINRRNDLNPDLRNEKIFGLEVGYGLRTDKFRGNLNLYRTSWKDRIINTTQNDVYNSRANKELPTIDAFANLYGVEQIHIGLEADFVYHLTHRLDITGSLSWGDWKYGGTVTTDFLNQADGSPIEDLKNPGKYLKQTVYLDGVKVGAAPQFITNIGLSYEIFDGFKIDGNYRYNDKFYALVDPLAFSKPDHKGSMTLPSFSLFDAGMSYKMRVGKDKRKSLNMRLNVNNLFDTTYISASRTNIQTGDVNNKNEVISSGTNWKGVDVANEVYFGAGRTWNFTMRYNF
ncbi:MAG: TonB-dependent receptor domain-containing protein, partial [Flavobacterium sp.]